MQLKIIILTLLLLIGFNGFSQQKDSLSTIKPKEINIIYPDSARVALDIVVDSSGKLITASYAADGSTTDEKTMIEIAKRRAFQIKYPAMKQKYKQRLMFNFKVVQ